MMNNEVKAHSAHPTARITLPRFESLLTAGDPSAVVAIAANVNQPAWPSESKVLLWDVDGLLQMG